jgi:hypothetical protein
MEVCTLPVLLATECLLGDLERFSSTSLLNVLGLAYMARSFSLLMSFNTDQQVKWNFL